jgi:hypothetical protein
MTGEVRGKCPHDHSRFDIRHERFEETNINYAEITGECVKCRARVRFHVRAPLGCHPELVTQAMDASSVNVPFLFGDDEYDGKATGFVGRMMTETDQ